MAFVIKVECYAGYRADERPLRFSRADQHQAVQTFEVNQILSQWQEPGYRCFKVCADDTNIYLLRHDTQQDIWSLDVSGRGRG